MNKTTIGLAAIFLAAATWPAAAQGPTEKPISAVPPATAHSNSVITNTNANSPQGMNSSGSKEGYTHNTGDVANGPTPPRQTGTRPPATASAGKAQPNGPSSTVHPGAAYSHGSANVGNSNENNGMLGSQGAAASATMQNGHTSNR